MSNRILSTQEIVDRAAVQKDIRDRAQADPTSITDADLPNMDTETMVELMNSGGLAHLGVGKPKNPKRPR